MVTLLSATAVEKMRGEGDSLGLEVLLEKLVGVTDRVGAQSLEIVSAETCECVQRGNDKLQGSYLVITLSDLFFEDNVGL